MAAAALHALHREDEIETRFALEPGAAIIRGMLLNGVNSPYTSSMGRWFDAAAGLLGVTARSAYEGEAAMRLEALALEHGSARPLPSGFEIHADATLDLMPLLAHLAGERDAARGAAVFHATLVAALAEWVCGAVRMSGLDTVALGGGCFLNGLVSTHLRAALLAHGLRVLEAERLPPNDGGLSLGQAWVAMRVHEQPARLGRSSNEAVATQ